MDTLAEGLPCGRSGYALGKGHRPKRKLIHPDEKRRYRETPGIAQPRTAGEVSSERWASISTSPLAGLKTRLRSAKADLNQCR